MNIEKNKIFFDRLINIQLIFYFTYLIKIFFYQNNFVPDTLVREVNKIYDNNIVDFSTAESILFFIFGLGLLILIPVSLFLMKKFKAIGRRIFLILTIISVPLIFFENFHLLDHLEYFLETCISLFSGGILYSAYFVLEKEFK